MKRLKIILPILLAFCWMTIAGFISSDGDDTLKAGFLNPPDSARPGVYWYFMDGNMSKEAMTKDLESMKKVGLVT